MSKVLNSSNPPQEENEERKRNIIVLIILGIILGLAFTAVNLGIFFDVTLLVPYLNAIFEVQGESQDAFSMFQTFKAINTLFFLVFLMIGGIVSDHISSKIGNRLPVIFTGLVISGLSYAIAPIFLPLNIKLPILGHLAPYYTGVIIYSAIAIGYGFIWAPSYALLSDLFTKGERATVAMLIAFLSSVGSFVGVILKSLFNIDSETIVTPEVSSVGEYTPVFLSIGAIFIFIGLLLILFIPKRNPKIKPEEGIVSDLLRTPRYLFELTRGSGEDKGDSSFLFMFLVQICWGVANFLIINNFAIFADEINKKSPLGVTGQDALIFLGLIGVIFAGPIIMLIGRIGKTRSAMLGSLVMGFAAFLLAQTVFWNFFGFSGIIILSGFASVLIATVTVALPADLVPKGKEGLFMGLFVVAFNFLNPIVAGFTILLSDPDNPLTGPTNIFLIVTVVEFIAVGLLTFIHYEDVVESEYNTFRRRYFIFKENVNSYTNRFRRKKY